MGYKEIVIMSSMPLHIGQPNGQNMAYFSDLTTPRPRFHVPTFPRPQSHVPASPHVPYLTVPPHPRVPRPQTRVPEFPSPGPRPTFSYSLFKVKSKSPKNGI